MEQISPELLELSRSSAWARPKIMVGISDDQTQFIHGQQDLAPGFEQWMIKFASSQERSDTGNIEYAYSLMARAAGLEMMPTQLFSAKKRLNYFGVKRFDRVFNNRVHMHSLSGLIDADLRLLRLLCRQDVIHPVSEHKVGPDSSSQESVVRTCRRVP
ncbi:MAG TPA: HipA domain-containing protein [Pirellula sp.]|nr:HipA domain-containing protein [Pirellula sp.]